MLGMCGSIWSTCGIPGLNEATAEAGDYGLFSEAVSKQALNFIKIKRPKSSWLW